MALRDRIAYLRKEHRALLQLADEIESALALGAKAGFPEHRKSISELRALEHEFQGIEEHCHAVVGGKVHMLDERKCAELFPDCEVGAVPPFGELYGLPVYGPGTR